MRTLKGTIAAIWLFGLAVVAVSALVEQDYARKPEPAGARRVVYVDKARLMAMHPAWPQVLSIRRAIAELAGKDSVGDVELPGSQKIVEPEKGLASEPSISRKQLADSLEQSALAALYRVEQYEKAKISRDLTNKRMELEAQMRAAVAEKANELDCRITDEKRDIIQSRLTDRLDMELKLAAIKSRIGSINSAEDQKAKEDLAAAQKMLESYDRETHEIIDEKCKSLKEDYEHFRTRARLELEGQLALASAEREGQVASAITSQRDDTLAELRKDALSSLTVDVKASEAAEVASGVDRPKIKTGSAGSNTAMMIQELRNVEKRLLNRISRDLERSIRAAAAEQKVTVVFEPGQGDIPDFTVDAARLIRGSSFNRRAAAVTEGSG